MADALAKGFALEDFNPDKCKIIYDVINKKKIYPVRKKMDECLNTLLLPQLSKILARNA